MSAYIITLAINTPEVVSVYNVHVRVESLYHVMVLQLGLPQSFFLVTLRFLVECLTGMSYSGRLLLKVSLRQFDSFRQLVLTMMESGSNADRQVISPWT